MENVSSTIARCVAEGWWKNEIVKKFFMGTAVYDDTHNCAYYYRYIDIFCWQDMDICSLYGIVVTVVDISNIRELLGGSYGKQSRNTLWHKS